jgi:hypothetical protein
MQLCFGIITYTLSSPGSDTSKLDVSLAGSSHIPEDLNFCALSSEFRQLSDLRESNNERKKKTHPGRTSFEEFNANEKVRHRSVRVTLGREREDLVDVFAVVFSQ